MRYFFIILFFLLSNVAQAADQVIKVAIADFPPFEFYNNSKIEGINHKTISDVLTRIGYKVEFYSLPWKRALELTKSGEMDALSSVPKTQDTQNIFILSDAIMSTKYYFFKNKNLDIEPKSFSDLSNYNIGIIDEYFYNEQFDKNSSLKFTPIVSSTPDVDNLQKLRYQRLDLVACSYDVCQYWLKTYPDLFANIDYLSNFTIDNGHTLHLAFSRQNQEKSNEIANKFNEELKKYIAEGNIKKNTASYSISTLDFQK